MNTSRFGDLEVLCHTPSGKNPKPTPLLFVHGAYTGAWCWEEHFLPWFAERGWIAYALSLSGHGKSLHHDHLDSLSIDDYVADLTEVVSRLPAAPVLVGHSMGGMVVQKYLERAKAPAVVLMSSVPPQGLMGSALGLMFKKPHLLTDLNRIMNGGEVQADGLREALFYKDIDEETLLRYYRLSQPESHRAVWDMTLFNLPQPSLMHSVPMLILGAVHDQLIPADQVHMTATTYGRRAEIFDDIGHAMMLEEGWEVIATRIAAWLEEQKL